MSNRPTSKEAYVKKSLRQKRPSSTSNRPASKGPTPMSNRPTSKEAYVNDLNAYVKSGLRQIGKSISITPISVQFVNPEVIRPDLFTAKA